MDAIALYRKAAETGESTARCRCAQALRHGDGVEKSIDEANRWQAKARALNPELKCDQKLDDMLF